MKLGSLGTKFSVLLALIWLVGGSATILTLSNHLNAQAEQTVRERAEIVLTAMQAARNYTQENIQPLVEAYSVADNSFTQEIIPNFAARSIFSNFRQQDPSFLDYLYKEAAINPTNTADLADSFESTLYPQLEPLTESPPETVSGYRTLNDQKFFYLAKPLIVKDASCLACHGNPKEAPAPLINLYGDRNGFGWNLNEIVATQMVYVPADMIFDRGQQNLWTVSKTFLGIFAALFITINLLLWRTVIRPLGILTETSKQISLCSVNEGKRMLFNDSRLTQLATRQDEPGQLARALKYMLYVLGQREQDLQRAVEDRTQSLSQEMHDRQTAQSALQVYTHAINHDMRNVAMGISSVVQGILFRSERQNTRAEPEKTPEKLAVEAKAITLIQKSCDRQLKLMDTLMEVRSADVWRLSLRPTTVNLHRLTADLLAMYEAKACTATFDNKIPAALPKLNIDAGQIQRVFENLIENALKYNPNGVNVVLAATLVPAQPSQTNPSQSHCHPQQVRCTVSDNGQGIAPENSKGLFDLYQRGERRSSVSGYGLGLYICREIVLAHGGQIGVDVSSSKGVTFWFTLPLQRPSTDTNSIDTNSTD